MSQIGHLLSSPIYILANLDSLWACNLCAASALAEGNVRADLAGHLSHTYVELGTVDQDWNEVDNNNNFIDIAFSIRGWALATAMLLGCYKRFGETSSDEMRLY